MQTVPRSCFCLCQHLLLRFAILHGFALQPYSAPDWLRLGKTRDPQVKVVVYHTNALLIEKWSKLLHSKLVEVTDFVAELGYRVAAGI